MAVFIYSGFWGPLEIGGLSYHKSVGIRDLFGSIEGGPLSGGPSSLRARKGQNRNGNLEKKPKNTQS